MGIGRNWYTASEDTQRSPDTQAFTHSRHFAAFTATLRKGGGPDYKNFQEIVDKNATEQFMNAKNFFNGGSTPQQDITPQV
ncbi:MULTISPECIES: hypothetical protein [unclassified Mesorhizobium]|uniref:hypothetical protein n=1 Tax=unclassified Mesorhizobium TaxID=325217 RepID=UPI000F758D16|nr:MULTISPECIES: hypothetical protein [unclassified Mesorhizobium]AZN98104.1 hypothetical protein EJ066_13200 [Mesorhizobium sp. M9A.F.Ca.ET.002.03.1.2]AZO19476.1 hypothetical protein EJ070_01185 [Mesorhizobium sp. M1E.F.Ca.ET.045.02.1.1]TGQ36867.1 hypothetical protein EN859_020810 [Mesorhizobium sp. M00.F.Ca.ET.216.01.1.1]